MNMRFLKKSILLYFTILSSCGLTQIKTGFDTDSVYDRLFIEKVPEFPGGLSAMYKFVSNNLQIPIDDGIYYGKVYLSFIVGTDSMLSDFRILKGTNTKFDAEVVRVFKMMPKWSPGSESGKAVRCRMVYPISVHIK